MSVFQIGLGGIDEPIATKITGSTVVDIVDGTSEGWNVEWFSVQENTGAGVPALTVELYDIANTTSYYLGAGGFAWKGKAMTNAQSVMFDAGYLVPIGWKLRVTSGDAAGKMEVSGVKTRRLG